MRRRVLFIALAVVALATVAISFWPVGSAHYHYRRSSSLVLSLLARTNGTVVVSLKNTGNQQFVIDEYASIEYLNPENPEEYFAEDFHSFTNSLFTLLPGAAFQVSFPAPTKHLKWRVNIRGVGQRQLARKKLMRRALNWTVVFRQDTLVLDSEYAQTDWIAP